MAKADVIKKKKQVVEDFKKKLEVAKVFVLSDFRRVSVKELTSLRKNLRPQESEYKVVKNTLLRRALDLAGFKDCTDEISGPTGLMLGYADSVGPIKTLVEFVADTEKGELRLGVMEKKVIDQAVIAQVAKLPSREVLVAKVLGGLQSPIYGLVNVLQGNLRALAYALKAVAEKKAQA